MDQWDGISDLNTIPNLRGKMLHFEIHLFVLPKMVNSEFDNVFYNLSYSEGPDYSWQIADIKINK